MAPFGLYCWLTGSTRFLPSSHMRRVAIFYSGRNIAGWFTSVAEPRKAAGRCTDSTDAPILSTRAGVV